ncbi:MAG TPA: ASKHA domain-containing protein [Coriobacteriia bacterium]|nr:ASKHA domain-containing protein [Coriobacteriia bacterium]
MDLGTTNIVARLIDADTGAVLAESRCVNRQVGFGADVLSRVSAAIAGEAASLTRNAVESVEEALVSALASAGIPPDALERIVVAGNTAMVSLLIGTDVTGLASHPFTHVLGDRATWVELGIAGVDPSVEVVLVPPVAAFVGGDLVAGLMAAEVTSADDGVLYIDLGTNAEVAAVANGRTWVTSAAAGPAFEGWGVACGGQAGVGGIVRVRADDTVGVVPAFEGERPAFITGSGLISALALLRRLGHLAADGTMRADGPLAGRFFDAGGVPAVTLACDPSDRGVFVDQRDVRGLQSAKAAVTVAVRSVARAAGLTGDRLTRVIVAGALGGALAGDDLVELGIVPQSGRASLRHMPDAVIAGAGAMAFRPELLKDAERFAANVTHVDLAGTADFAEAFLGGLELAPYDV